jgi:3',5'-cyclic AMP phosphodiesterase CpdA
MLDNITTTILHLSDLHLGEDFADVGSKSKADGLGAGAIESFRKNYGIVMQTHDSWIIPCLENEILLAARYLGAPEDTFDFNVITGDISTDVNPPERFKFAREYLTGTVPVTPGSNFQVGLRMPRESVFCVPGNHDKMALTDNNFYLEGFKDLPGPLPYVKEVTSSTGQRLVFYGIDSNLYLKGNIAVGEISPVTLAWLNESLTLTDTADGRPLPVRILLLHHHPADLNQFRPWTLKSLFRSFGKSFSVLQEGDRLLKTCRGRIDLIMHGHEHFPIVFHEEVSSSIVVSSGTSSSFLPEGKGPNTFHAIALSGREFHIVQFNWNGARFYPGKEWTGNLSTPSQIKSRQLAT